MDDEPEETFDADGDIDDEVPDEDAPEPDEEGVVEKVIHKVAQRIMVPADERITSDRITRMELSMVVQLRIGQLNANGATTCKDITGMDDPADIAMREIAEGVSPLILERVYDDADGNKRVEHWEVRTMRLPV